MRPAVPEPQQQRSIATRRRLLDAAVAELLDHGYGAVTTVGVARRAGVTRGAQQHHFPMKEALVAEAVRHLNAISREQLAEQIGALPRGRRRLGDALDLIYAQYRGPVFVAIFELSLAGRRDPELRELVSAEEQKMASTIFTIGREVLGKDALGSAETAARWATALSTIRGIAILQVLGHSERALQRQWRYARRQLLENLGS